MHYRQLGRTGVSVSRLGFGALHINASVENAVLQRLMERCVEAGINYIDTARGYGESERMLGTALVGLRDKFILSTKSIARERSRVEEDLETSLRLLKTDCIDLYFLHDVSRGDEYRQLVEDGIYEFVSRARERGLIRHVCMSTHDLTIAQQIVESDRFDCIMLAYNIADRCVDEQLLPLAAERKVGTVIMKPFGGGVLCGERGRQHGVDLSAQDLIRFVLSCDTVDTVIPGIDREGYLEECIAAEELSPLSRREAAKLLQEVESFGTDFCRGCGYCEPCPQEIPIRDIMQLYSRYRAFQGANWQAMFALNGEMAAYAARAGECESCRECEEKCPFDLPITDVMRKVAG